MCPKWNFLGAARGWCNQHWAVRHKSNMCDIHPLWQQALDGYELVQIEKGESDASK
jgi:hypothetical protein